MQKNNINKFVLITGAAGFIGSMVAKSFLDKGFKVLSIDNFSTGLRSNIPNGVDMIEGDVGDKNIIKELLNYEIDGIIHIAGQSSGQISFENPIYDLKTNALSTLLLLKYAITSGIKKFLYASSMSVYGNMTHFPVREDSITAPESIYAVGKLASEQYLRIFSQKGICTTALRLFNVYGPGQNLSNLKQGMLSIYLAQALYSKEVIVTGTIDRFRDFVYIDDVVEAFSLLYFMDQQNPFSLYNVCSGKPKTVDELLQKIEYAIGSKLKIRIIDGIIGDQFGIYGDFSHLNQDTGWQPRTSFTSGLNNMIVWAKNIEEKN
jgi:UDP-glucose 4-epimerase